MSYIHVYKNNPTANDTDGTLVSEGDSSSFIICTLNATSNEVSSPIKLALRCDGANAPSAPNGYQTTGNTVITPTGDTSTKWALALDSSGSAGTFGAYGAALTITSVIGQTNVLFWAKAKATSDETPTNDQGTDLVVVATIAAV